MADFSILLPLSGGALIGLAAVILMLGSGRVMGASGILAGMVQADGRSWRLGFLAGVALAGLLFFRSGYFSAPDQPLAVLALAGFLVGLGSRMGNGCTSGHGICGLARLSKRSVVAVLTFMTTAFLTVLIMRHGWGG